MPSPAPERIDAHQHFWIYDPAAVPVDSQGQRITPRRAASGSGPRTGAVGDPRHDRCSGPSKCRESEWLLDLAEHDDRIRGVVGWVDLRSDKVEADLASLSAHPKFVGVRHVVQDEPHDRFLLSESFVCGVGKLGPFGLTYDLLIYPRQLPAAIELVQQFPEQLFVLDHIAKPEIRNGSVEPWRKQIEELAKFPNVWCKVSGMVTEADHQHWKPDDIRPYLDIVFDAFSTQRIMWGSDWPVCLLATEYVQVFDLVETYTRSFADSERAAVFGGNAQRFYLSTR